MRGRRVPDHPGLCAATGAVVNDPRVFQVSIAQQTLRAVIVDGVLGVSALGRTERGSERGTAARMVVRWWVHGKLPATGWGPVDRRASRWSFGEFASPLLTR